MGLKIAGELMITLRNWDYSMSHHTVDWLLKVVLFYTQSSNTILFLVDLLRNQGGGIRTLTNRWNFFMQNLSGLKEIHDKDGPERKTPAHFDTHSMGKD